MKKHLLMLAMAALMPLGGLMAQSTDCDTITDEMMPYYEYFDDYDVNTMPPCWVGMGLHPLHPDYPKITTSSYASQAVNVLSLYGGRSVDSASYAVMPYMDSVNDKIVRMSLFRSNSVAEMWVGVMTDPNDTSTFVTVGHFVPYPATNWSTARWTRHECSLSGYTGNGHYIAFRSYCTSGGMQLYMDSVEVDFAPCDRADSVVVSNIAYTSATLTVYDPSEANSYRIEYCNTADLGVSANAWTTDFMNSSTYSFDNLEAGNEYRVVLVTVCPDGSETTPFDITFRTPCHVLTADDMPQEYTFDDLTAGTVFYPNCWEMLDEVTYNHPVSVSNTHYGPEGNSIMMTPNQAQNQYVILPEIDNLQGLQMTFYVKGNTNNNLAVGVITDPTDANSFTPLLTIDHVLDDGWNAYLVDFSSYSGDDGRIAFKGGVIYAMDYSIYIDNITIDLMPTCAAPTSVGTSNIGETEATIAIVDSASADATYEMTVMTDDTTWVEYIYQPDYWMTGLEPGTDYTVTIVKLCDDGTHTFPVSTSFKTLCEPITAVPWEVYFESPSDLDCWLVRSFNGLTGDNWQIETESNYTGGHFIESYHASGSIATNEWLISPAIQLAEGATGYTLYYTYQGRMHIGYNAAPRLEVRVSTTDRNDTNTFTDFITTETTYGDTWMSRSFSLDNYAGDTIYIAFVRQNTNDLSVRLDSIAIRNENMPQVEIIAPDEASTESVTEYIAHMLTGGTSGISYTWTSSMEDAGDAETEKAGDTLRVTYHAEGTDTVTVVVYNGIGYDTAIAIVPVINCAVSQLPWSEDFEGYSYSSGTPLAPSCWTVFGFSQYGYAFPNLNSSTSPINAGHNSDHCYVVQDAGGSNPMAMWILPPFTDTLNTLQVRFFGKTTASVFDGNGALEVGYVSSATNPGGFTLVQGIGLDTVWQEFTVRMPAEAQGRIAFRVTSAGLVRVDDIVVEVAPEVCEAPTVVIDTVTTTSVSFNVPDAEGEVLSVSSYVSDGTTQTQELVHGSSWTISNLEPGTDYTLYVRHICHIGDTSVATEMTFTTLQECTAPQSVSVSNTTATGASISWTAVPSATSYTVRVGDNSYTASGTSYSLIGLTPNTNYTVGVQAHCPSGDSPWAEAGFTTANTDGIGTVADGLNVSLWPNPATDRVVIDCGAPAHVSIVDLSGREVNTFDIATAEYELNVSQMARGAYFVRISTDMGTAVVKLMVE